MKIAVATEEGKIIYPHFGRSPFFEVFEIEEGRITNRSMRQNTFTRHSRENHEGTEHAEHHHGDGDPHAHQSAAEGLKDCAVVISRGMGRRAWEDLRAKGIEMIVTEEREVETAVQKYLAGGLVDRTEKLH
ncbi:MAG: NifB/NifX family molybdenum-iron cluster-binding protein [Bacteroidota bacterium]